jgi:hypothetical protein
MENNRIILDDIQLCDVLVMSDTIVSVRDMGDEEGELITLQDLQDNTSTHWVKGNLAVLSTFDYQEGYLQFRIYNEQGQFQDNVIFEEINDGDIYSTLEKYFDMDNYMKIIERRRKNK